MGNVTPGFAYTKLPLDTPAGPIVAIVRHDGSVGVRDAAGPINAPEAAEFVVNRVPLGLSLEFDFDAECNVYVRQRYPGGGSISKRHSVKWNDNPSWATQDKVVGIVTQALQTNRDQIVAMLPELQAQANENEIVALDREINKLEQELDGLTQRRNALRWELANRFGVV